MSYEGDRDRFDPANHWATRTRARRLAFSGGMSALGVFLVVLAIVQGRSYFEGPASVLSIVLAPVGFVLFGYLFIRELRASSDR